MFFEETIKSKKGGFSIEFRNRHNNCWVLDGDELDLVAEVISVEEFRKKVFDCESNSAALVAMFKTKRGNKVYYWRDIEEDRDFITIYNPFLVYAYTA